MGTGASYVAMVLVQLAYGGSNILVKIALEKGINRLVFIVYRHLIAVLLVGPFAYVLEREQRPPFSIKVMAKIFVLSSLGTTIYLNVYYAGLEYTSATVATALSNPIPCLTFLLAVLLRMEELNIEKASGQAKVIGTLICLGGSLMFTFWKGGYQMRSLLKRPLISLHDPSQASDVSKHGKENWIKGSLLILTGDVAWSAWLILQAVVYKDYPARLSLTVWIGFFASLQSSVLSLFFARNRSLWKLEANEQLWAIIYCGVVLSALVYYLQTWCISREGPVFAAMFGPLVLVFVAIFSAVAFNEQLHLSSLIAACIIVLGLYCVLWGKRKESLYNAQAENRKGAADCNAPEISVTTAK